MIAIRRRAATDKKMEEFDFSMFLKIAEVNTNKHIIQKKKDKNTELKKKKNLIKNLMKQTKTQSNI